MGFRSQRRPRPTHHSTARGQAATAGKSIAFPIEEKLGRKIAEDKFRPSDLTPAAVAKLDATFGDIRAALFGALRGAREAVLAQTALLQSGGVEGAPTWGASRNGGYIANWQYKGQTVLPVGTLVRSPSRMAGGEYVTPP